ncbi:uncharacterized protein LOC106670834 [Cimex lectularius]|uniref:DDB1- and CUL4-associated factor 15 WD40 repeat-containing domain-containing protein n=1 Tax=Cimex lectularius TaxID=79782 RepID=A0A8I6S6V2_CIMLE|nr:uncharacterized protein LOC106670834 [Cimex lectularius]
MNLKKYGRQNLLQKLYNRQIFGQFIRGVSVHHEPTKQLFSKVPDRLVFSLCDTIPNVGNHILMGATRCGQILLTYTYSVDTSTDFAPSFLYRYRLHFWLFRPGRPSAKIAEVQLFDGAQVTEMLTIGLVQWPHDNRRLLVFGSCQGPNSVDIWGSDVEFKSSTYITLTTLPSLQGCDKCKLVASTFSEDEMAANWDAGVGLTCFNHGLTIHTHFSAPHVYTFDPETCLASDGRIVFNTGSFLHVLSMSVENGLETPTYDHSTVIKNRLTFSFLRDRNYSLFLSEYWDCNMIQFLIKKLRQGLQIDQSQLNIYLQYALQRHLLRHSAMKCKFRKDKDLMTCGQLAVMLLDANRPKHKWFSSNNRGSLHLGVTHSKPVKRSFNADNVYDFMESEEICCEPKFKLYRRRCLADKMYEFRSDEELVPLGKEGNENIRPAEVPSLKDNDSKMGVNEKDCVGRPQFKTAEPSIVKAIIADWDLGAEPETEAEKREKVVTGFLAGLGKGGVERKKKWSPLKPHNKERPGDCLRVDFKSAQARNRNQQRAKVELTDEMRKEIKSGLGHQPVTGCSVRFARSYIEIDQEITSTITEIEDDDIGPGFHCALPISAHGSSYSQMEMISNLKAEKLTCPLAVVRQSSLDIEQFCFKAAEAICEMEGYKFWFCSDYDTEIVKVCQVTGEVLGVLFIRLNAEYWDKLWDDGLKRNRADLRNFYETACLYIWNPSTGGVYLEGYKTLRMVPMVAVRPWCPAGKEASILRQSISFIPSLRPRFFIHTVKEGMPILPMNLILDHENLIGFRRMPMDSNH